MSAHFVLQEFCLFALVGLWTDFFLQMFFFATILSVDIRRMEVQFYFCVFWMLMVSEWLDVCAHVCVCVCVCICVCMCVCVW